MLLMHDIQDSDEIGRFGVWVNEHEAAPVSAGLPEEPEELVPEEPELDVPLPPSVSVSVELVVVHAKTAAPSAAAATRRAKAVFVALDFILVTSVGRCP